MIILYNIIALKGEYMKKTLIIIDPQLEYSVKGHLPVQNYAYIIEKCEQLISKFNQTIIIKHINQQGLFSDTLSEIDPQLKKYNCTVLSKKTADAFDNPLLSEMIDHTAVYLCGMMTQNCVLLSALGALDNKFTPVIIEDCCGSLDIVIHNFAIRALQSKRIPTINSSEL